LEVIAAAFRELGLEDGTRVLVLGGNHRQTVKAIFGAIRANLTAVPVNPLFGRPLIDRIVDDTLAAVAFCDPEIVNEATVAFLSETIGAVVGIEWNKADDELVADIRSCRPRVHQRPSGSEQELMVLYTSGSTGHPKGVILDRQGQRWFQSQEWRLSPLGSPLAARNALVGAPLFHNAGLLRMMAMMAYGGTTVLLPEFNANRFLASINEYGVSHAAGTPAMYRALLQEMGGDVHEFPTLKYLRVGGAACPSDLLARLRSAFGCTAFQVWGLTEGGPIPFGFRTDGGLTPPGSIGVPFPDTRAVLKDADGNEVKRRGELWISNPGIAKGYLNRPEETRARFQGGWLATRDILEVDEDGFWYFIGRADDTFKCGGESVHPSEVENIVRQCPGVEDVCVIPVRDDMLGFVPVAAVVVEQGSGLTGRDIRRFCLDRFPTHMQPRIVKIVDQLPVVGQQKVDKNGLMSLFKDLTAARVDQ
jgi:acyl-CoA synthetase (AMP-forming)/AMP-acid ligase II